MNRHPEEPRWIEALRSDDRATRANALDAIYRAYGPGLLGLCLRITCHRGDGEDALQETFVQVLRYGASFRGESALRTWITRIAIRAALEIRARKGRRAEAELLDPPADLEPGPDGQAADDEQASRLLAAISRLSAEQRVVLGLFAFDGLAGADIAEVLGIPEGTVHSRLHTARAKLRAMLESKAPTERAGRARR